MYMEGLRAGFQVLHTAVGRRPEAAREFAARYSYRKWTLSLDEAKSFVGALAAVSSQLAPTSAGVEA